MSLIVEPFLAFLFLVAAGFFSAAETALVTLSPQKTKHLALRNPKLAGHLTGWLTKPHELIVVILMGSTLSVVLFAAFTTSAALRVFEGFSRSRIEGVSWLAQTVLMTILGEMAPKFLARLHPERISLFALPLLAATRQIMAPFLNIVTKAIGYFMPAWVTPPVGPMLTFSMDELRLLIDESRPRNIPQADSLTMIQRALDLNNKSVQEIMTKMDTVDFLDLDAVQNQDRALDLIIENGHTRTPIRRGGEFIGYLHTHDLLSYIIDDREQKIESKIIPAHALALDMKVSELLQIFKQSGVHIGFVRNPNGGMAGIVTLEDVMEEITGEILDEYDVTQNQIDKGTAS